MKAKQQKGAAAPMAEDCGCAEPNGAKSAQGTQGNGLAHFAMAGEQPLALADPGDRGMPGVSKREVQDGMPSRGMTERADSRSDAMPGGAMNGGGAGPGNPGGAGGGGGLGGWGGPGAFGAGGSGG
jgi:hypothetical protein